MDVQIDLKQWKKICSDYLTQGDQIWVDLWEEGHGLETCLCIVVSLKSLRQIRQALERIERELTSEEV